MNPRFIQIHFLTSYPAALLNRDDVGFAKRLPFGGTSRTRISSQCLKRHWRHSDGEHSLSNLDVPPSIRSRRTFDNYILRPLINDGVDSEKARLVVEALIGFFLGQSAKARQAKAKEGEAPVHTGQITVLGRPEVDYLLETARELCSSEIANPKDAGKKLMEYYDKEGKKNLAALRCGCGLGAALFGRMVTSDILARGDAAVHVAHAFTVHAEESESDYFSAVDDLLQGGEGEELGSGHIGTTELTSGLYYGYVVVDVPLLVSNLTGCKRKEWAEADRGPAGEIVENLIHLIATVSPGAKLGSTAPHAYAHCVLLEGGNTQPRTLANAFLKPVKDRSDLLRSTYNALSEHARELDRMYGADLDRRVSAIGPVEALEGLVENGPRPLAEIASWAGALVRGA